MTPDEEQEVFAAMDRAFEAIKFDPLPDQQMPALEEHADQETAPVGGWFFIDGEWLHGSDPRVAAAFKPHMKKDWRLNTTTDYSDVPMTHAEERVDGLDTFTEFLEGGASKP